MIMYDVGNLPATGRLTTAGLMFLDKCQIEQVLDNAPPLPSLIVRTMLATGASWSQARALRYQDIDFGRHRVSVTRYADPSDRLRMLKKSFVAEISIEATCDLDDHRFEAYYDGATDHVFSTSDGGRLPSAYLNRVLMCVFDELGWPETALSDRRPRWTASQLRILGWEREREVALLIT